MRLDLEAPVAAEPCCSSLAFEMDGQHYALIAERDWDRQRWGIGRPATVHPVGRLMVHGVAHVVIEAQEPAVPAEDACPALPPAADLLTRRELEVAMLVASGKCDKEIARALGISGYTVREHIRRTFAKLGVCRRTAIVSYVLRSIRPLA